MSWPPVSAEHYAAVARVLDSGRLIDAAEVDALEHEFADYVGAGHCAAVSNGTAAIYAALMALGVGEGDEVVIPSLTFSGTVLPVLAVGAYPRFCDIDPETFNLDFERLDEAITARTRAVILVHLHGLTADVRALRAMIPPNVHVVEDACQAPGAYLPTGERAGTVGTLGVFSLNETKPLWAGEGGLVITDDPVLAYELRRVRRFGEDVDNGGRRGYVTERMGMNLRMPELSAAIARCSLGQLSQVNARARSAGQYLSSRLADVDLRVPHVPAGADHVYHKYRITVPSMVARNALLASDAPVTTWQSTALPNHPQFFDPQREQSGKVAQWALDHSVVVGPERSPIGEQRFETLMKWADKIRSVLA